MAITFDNFCNIHIRFDRRHKAETTGAYGDSCSSIESKFVTRNCPEPNVQIILDLPMSNCATIRCQDELRVSRDRGLLQSSIMADVGRRQLIGNG